MEHFADRLLAACAAKGAGVCVGIDPVLDKLPRALRELGDPVEAIRRFGVGVIDASAPSVPAVKLQAACFERYGGAGFDAMLQLTRYGRQRGLLVILDAKRGDIGVSSDHYAAALAEGDAVTVAPYMGDDSLLPFIEPAAAAGRGVFVLVRTSNPGGDALQTLRLADGRTVSEAVAALAAKLGDACVGSSGYSAVGAVVGATKASEAAALRALMPRQVFLVPGYGAQGAGADDVRACFDARGQGAIVTASRSVIYAFHDGDGDWRDAVGAAAATLRDEVRAAVA